MSSHRKWFPKLSRSVVVGLIATAADWASLIVLVQVFKVRPEIANLPTICLGSVIQFFGNRNWAFRAENGKLRLQAFGFAGVELCSLFLNWLGFHLMFRYTHVPYFLIRPLVTTAIYLAFSYPLWHFVFRSKA